MQLVDRHLKLLYSFTVVYLIRIKPTRKNSGNLVTLFKFFTESLGFFNAVMDMGERG